MGKYSSSQRKPAGSNPKKTVNPVMRGIGCLFMVIVPVFSYFVGKELAGRGFASQILPASWYGGMTLSPKLTQLSGFNTISTWLSNSGITPASLAIAIVVIIVVGGIISIIFGYMYNLLTPAKYTGMDVPAPRVKTKKYKR